MPRTSPRRRTGSAAATSGSAGRWTYRDKRDFTRTREPAGATVPVESLPAGSRFVVQRHRARRLHYDFRLEMGGVLASWAVPKGPTLDPSVRRAAFHVEDHPLEYYDFEGVIPAGEYGGGDVIVWDAGTWDHYYQREGRDPVDAVGHGELHMELDGQKLKGKFVLVRTSVDDAGKESWLLLHKKDEFVVAGWDAEEHPRSVLSGRTNDEVKADPDRLWRSDLPAAEAAIALHPPTFEPVSRAELRALDRIGASGRWEVFGHDVRLTNLDKVLFPPRGREKPVTKRDLVRYAAQIAPTLVPYLTRRALNMHRFPNGVGTAGFWHKELPGHAPSWLARWDNPDADPGETLTYLVVDEPATLVWVANYGALEWHAWTSRVEDPNRPTYALVDLDPGERTTWPELLAPRAAAPDGVRAPRRRGVAEADRPARHPDLGTGRDRTVVRRDPRVGGAGVAHRGRGHARAGELEVAGPRPIGSGPAGLHPERDQQDPGGALQPAGRSGGAGLRADRVGRARRPQAPARPLHDPDHPAAPRRARRPLRPGPHDPPAPPHPPLTT